MKAWHIDRFGPPDVLDLRSAPTPVPRENEVLVAVRAASVNPADAKMRSGVSPGAQNLSFPHILGRDFSGVVESVGTAVADLAPGDEVFGVLEQGTEGAYAEKLVVAAGLVARKPSSLTHAEAAALALTGLTALTALEDVAKLQRGQRVLIHAGAGGVGSFAVQYARHVGAEVLTTASPRNHEYAKALGADIVIDYTAQPFEEVATDCDVVFDPIGGDVHRRSLAVLRPGGILVHIVPAPKDAKPPEGRRVVRPNVGRDRAHMERIAELVARGAVRPPAIEVIPFSDARRAHTQIETGHVRGKLVLEIPI